jgi:uncharacterized protein (TIGR02117 family)
MASTQLESARPVAPIGLARIVQTSSRWLGRAGRALFALLQAYLLTVLIGFWPVNNNFRPPADGVTIYVISNAVHADLVVPLNAAGVNWREFWPDSVFRENTDWATHAAIGWGDRGFYLHTPTWKELRVSTALYALFWPSPSCMHVDLCLPEELPSTARRVIIAPDQYAALVQYIRQSFVVDEHGRPAPISGEAYGPADAFFEAHGAYTAINTCNAWLGRALRQAGVRTGWYTPWPKSVQLYLP